jgi:tetratricopeptide (TPR) repeat protein
LRTSVFLSPALSSHGYLSPRFIRWLSPQQIAAVESALKDALAQNSTPALDGLADLYAETRRLHEQAALYERAASATDDTSRQVNYLIGAARAYNQISASAKAEELLRAAIARAPEDPRPYHYLLESVFVSKNDLPKAQALVAEGITNGLDAYDLLVTLADTAEKEGDREQVKKALLRAIDLRPDRYDLQMRVGSLYIQLGEYDRAALAFKKAEDLKPSAADASFQLGMAEEQSFRYSEANQAFSKAIKLDPANVDFRVHFEEFQHKMEKNLSAN